MKIPGRHRANAKPPEAPAERPADELDEGELARMFRAPTWLRDLGLQSWLLFGIGAVLFGAIWLLGEISTIVTPVVAGTIVAAVASPLVGAMQAKGLPRLAGAFIVLLLLIALAVIVALLVFGGIVENSAEIKASATQALDKVEGWANDAGADGTSSAKQDVSKAVPDGGAKLLKGAASGIKSLTSMVFFLSFALFATFFMLKDGPVVRRWVDRHLGVPLPVATTITRNVVGSLRRYFLGVTIVAAFNGIVVGIAAVLLDVPLAGTIAVVTFVTAYVPFIGAFVSGAFAVIIALAEQGTTTALIMLVVVLLANGLLQNIVQPVAFGATLDLNPLVVLIVTIGAGGLFGMVGLVLGAPLTSAAVHIARDLQTAKRPLRGPPEPAPDSGIVPGPA
jgi:putative heme transporter